MNEVLLRQELDSLVTDIVEAGIRCWKLLQTSAPHATDATECPDCRDEAWRYIKIVYLHLNPPAEE